MDCDDLDMTDDDIFYVSQNSPSLLSPLVSPLSNEQPPSPTSPASPGHFWKTVKIPVNHRPSYYTAKDSSPTGSPEVKRAKNKDKELSKSSSNDDQGSKPKNCRLF